MVSHDEVQGAIIRDLQNYKNVAYGLIFTIFAASIAIRGAAMRNAIIPPTDRIELVLYVCRIATLVVLILYIFRWIAVSTTELNVCISYIYIGNPRPCFYLAMFMLGLSLGLLPAFAFSTFSVFAGYMCVHLMIEFWVYRVFRDQYQRCRQLTKREGFEHSRILEALDKFWLYRPHLRRVCTVWMLAVTSCLLSVAASSLKRHWEISTTVFAVVLLLSSVLVAEFVVLWRWHAAQMDGIEKVLIAAAKPRVNRTIPTSRCSTPSRDQVAHP